MDFDVSSTLLASGSSDRTIKLWDIDKQYCTHNLKGHTGVIRWDSQKHCMLIFVIHFLHLKFMWNMYINTKRLKYHKCLCRRKKWKSEVLEFVEKSLKLDTQHMIYGQFGVVMAEFSCFSTVKFHPDNEKLQLFSAADDYKVKVWDLRTSKCQVTVEAHYSVVTSMVFSPDNATMYR